MDLDNPNGKLADNLAEIASYYENSNIQNDKFRYKVYLDAANNIRNYPYLLSNIVDVKSRIPKIGTSLTFDINEFFTIGYISRLEQLRSQNPTKCQILQLFTSIHGIGPVSAAKFYDQGYRSLLDLWNSSQLTHAQQIGILYREHFNLAIPRSEMDIIKNELTLILANYDQTIQWEITGSYRRQEPTSNDIDILIKLPPSKTLVDIINLFKSYSLIPADISFGDIKYMGVLQLPGYNAHRLDILVKPYESWAYSLMHFTGSAKFNILMRDRAISKGLKLSENSLVSVVGLNYYANTESEIFDYLDIAYLPPESRTKDIMSLPVLY